MTSDDPSTTEASATASSSDPPPDSDPHESPQDRVLRRLETRLARAEAQIQTLQESASDFYAYVRVAKQRALYLRIGILVALLAAFFFMQYQR